MKKVIALFITLCFALALPAVGLAAGFGAGNLVVVRVGDGSVSLSSASAPVFLDEYTPGGVKVQTITLPTAANLNNKPITVSGSATSEGALRRSTDGRFLTLAGYATPPGTASVVSTTSASVNRVVARVAGDGSVDTTSSISNLYSANNIRGAVTTDGSGFWTTGPNNGVAYLPYGTNSATQLSTTVVNTRVPGIFNNQLYLTSASGAFQGVSAVGSGAPTTSGQTIAALSGFPTASGPSPYGFVMTDPNTVYIADDRAVASGGGIQKWTLNGSTWSLAYTLNAGLTSGARGVTAAINGSTVILYATTADSKLVTVTDAGSVSSFQTLAVAGTNTAFRGVDLTPLASVNGTCGSDNGLTLAAAAPSNLCGAGTQSAVIGSGHPWSWNCNGIAGGTMASCQATIQSYTLNFASDGNGSVDGPSLNVDYNGTASVIATPNAGYAFMNWTGPGNFTSTANPLVVANVIAAASYTAHFASKVDGACGSDNGQTLAVLAPTHLCDAGNSTAVAGSGHPWSWSCNGLNGGSTASCSAAIKSYQVKFVTSGSGNLGGSTVQTVDFGGSTGAVTANPASEFNFVNWTGTGGLVPTTANPLVISNVTANQTVTANFSGNLTIYHVNDTHARITPHMWQISQHGTGAPAFEAVGGAAFLAAEMLQLVAQNPSALVIDAGDISEGNPIGDMNGNGSMTRFYTLLSNKLKAQRGRGMDAVVVGNHDVRDVNYVNNLLSLQNSGVPVLSVNIRDINTHLPYFAPYTILNVNNVKVAIVGYTTAASEVGASLANTLEVATVDWKSSIAGNIHLADIVKDLRDNQGVQVVILAAHIGHSGLVDPAAPILADDGTTKLPEVAITGHWHTWSDTVWQPYVLNYKTVFAESSSYMKYIGEVKIDNTGRYLNSAQHVLRNSDITPDPDAQALVNGLIAQYNGAHPGQAVDRIVGYTADNLMLDNDMKWWSADEYPWSGNNTAGQWICDAMKWKAQQLSGGNCDLAMEAGGGVRADIPAGPVTYMQIYETFPWNDDTFTIVKMTGQEIVNFLKTTTMDAGFSSDLEVTAVDGVPTEVKFQGSPIDLNHIYRVAINNYMYAHPPAGLNWSDTNPTNYPSNLCRDGIVDFMSQWTQSNPYHVGGDRYHLNGEYSGGYRAVITMMNDNDTKASFEDAFIRLVAATPETLARRGSHQVPNDLVKADGTVNAGNRLSEQEMYRSFLGFKKDALKPGDIIETWGKAAFYGGNPEFVDQEGIYADGVEFRIVGHDDSMAKPAFFNSIKAFWNDNYKNHYVQFLGKRTGTSTVADQNGQSISVMDATGYAPKTLPGANGDLLLVSGVLTMESYGLRFRCDKAAASALSLPAPSNVSSHLDQITSSTDNSTLTLSASAAFSNIYTLTPVADAQVASGRATTNYNTTNLYVQSSSTNSYGNERAWMRFDLSGIPSDATITGATLQLWDWKATGAALPVEVRGGSDDTWSESAINWNTQAGIATAPVLDTQTLAAGTVNVWYNWNVGSFVQTKWGSNKLVSLVLKAATEGSADATAPSFGFDAKEYGSNAPVLQVTTHAGAAGVAKVDFYYRYSADNSTWGAWTLTSTATTAPYTASFSYPNGTGYYEFYSQATDSNNVAEPVSAVAQTATHYTMTPAFYPIVSLGNIFRTYDGSAKSVDVTANPSGTPVSVTYNGSTEAPTAAGSYTVLATTAGVPVAGATMTIAKAVAAVDLGNLYYKFDGSPKGLAVSTAPQELPVIVNYLGSPSAPSAAGIYPVVAVVNDTNYQGGATGTLVIGPYDISSQVSASPGGTTLNRATKLSTGNITVTNIGTTVIDGTVALALKNLPSGITLANAAGTYNGMPYLEKAVTLAPGSSALFPVAFSNPMNQVIRYTPVSYWGSLR